MIHENYVYVAGKVTGVTFHMTRNGTEYAIVKMVVVKYKGENEKYPAFLSLMVFNENQVKYLKAVFAKEGDFANVVGELSSTKSSQGYMQLTILVKDITIAKTKRDAKETPNLDDVVEMDEAMEDDF